MSTFGLHGRRRSIANPPGAAAADKQSGYRGGKHTRRIISTSTGTRVGGSGEVAAWRPVRGGGERLHIPGTQEAIASLCRGGGKAERKGIRQNRLSPSSSTMQKKVDELP
jgi:hypothetical protein